ncbi:hypothetical protein BDV28DRAFT_146639 [Aspergillus coremiiformis]|uniref:Uncharacterized protein n=1 Tax=Aspergillus coremiiformis TaxID=138285 RepID=A0A5N6ZBF1_9EURO|nr:hypothetical protein BDV28DRAFT_146639 [Aspergillus coremiiformis]
MAPDLGRSPYQHRWLPPSHYHTSTMRLTYLARYPQIRRLMKHPTYPWSMEDEESLRSENIWW